jgi:hypothetical protein
VDTIGDGQDLVDRRIRDVFGTKEQTSVIEWESTGLSDSEVLDRFLNDRTGTKFRRLWSGDFYEVGYDESRAEFTIARKLNFYTGDPEQTERIMRNNPNIARQKWDTHRTYLVGTITKADPEKFHTPSSDLEINVSPQDSTQLSNHGLYKARDDDWNEFLPSYTTDELYDMAREETPWVMEGIAAKGAVTDFYGPAKHGGKTTFMTHACASIVEGVPFIGCDVRKDKILYLTEMAPDNFKDYLQKAGICKGEDFRTVFKMDVWELPWGLLIDAAGKMCANEGRGGSSWTPSQSSQMYAARRKTTPGTFTRSCPRYGRSRRFTIWR